MYTDAAITPVASGLSGWGAGQRAQRASCRARLQDRPSPFCGSRCDLGGPSGGLVAHEAGLEHVDAAEPLGDELRPEQWHERRGLVVRERAQCERRNERVRRLGDGSHRGRQVGSREWSVGESKSTRLWKSTFDCDRPLQRDMTDSATEIGSGITEGTLLAYMWPAGAMG